MKHFFTLIAVCFFITIQAQEDTSAKDSSIMVGVKGALSLPSLSDNSNNIFTENFKSYVSFETGIFSEFSFSDLLALKVELNYTVKGGERSGYQPLPDDSYITTGQLVYGTVDNKTSLNYIELPILAKFTFGDDWKFFGNVGPYLGFLVDAKQTIEGTIDLNFGGFPIALPVNTERNIKDDLRSFNVGGVIGIGVAKDISEKSQVFFEARGSYGFIPIQKNEVFGKSKIGSVLFSLGYAYKL